MHLATFLSPFLSSSFSYTHTHTPHTHSFSLICPYFFYSGFCLILSSSLNGQTFWKASHIISVLTVCSLLQLGFAFCPSPHWIYLAARLKRFSPGSVSLDLSAAFPVNFPDNTLYWFPWQHSMLVLSTLWSHLFRLLIDCPLSISSPPWVLASHSAHSPWLSYPHSQLEPPPRSKPDYSFKL